LFICISEKQLTDFDTVHQALKDDAERRELLTAISKNYPNKLVIGKAQVGSLEKVFSYKNDIQRTIDSIGSMRTFFFLTDLPDDFTEDFSIEQIVRYGQIIEIVKRCSKLELDKEQVKAMERQAPLQSESGSVASKLDNF
jgi:hypothetical protein